MTSSGARAATSSPSSSATLRRAPVSSTQSASRWGGGLPPLCVPPLQPPPGTASLPLPRAQTFDFGEAPRNTISWSPHARFLALAGFGNLSGELSFWDRKTLKCLGTARRRPRGRPPLLAAHARPAVVAAGGRRRHVAPPHARHAWRGQVEAHMTVAYEWSPDSRHFLTAILFPRLRVDNGAPHAPGPRAHGAERSGCAVR